MNYQLLGLPLATVLLLGCTPFPTDTANHSTSTKHILSERQVTLKRTTHGIVHVTAPNYYNLAYGLAYAYAQDNFCMLAEHVVKVSGERARFFGPGDNNTNLNSDFYYRYYYDLPRLRDAYAKASPEVRDLAAGYAAGYNHYRREANSDLPCTNKSWVRDLTVDDMYRLFEEKAVVSGKQYSQAMVTAAPPTGDSTDTVAVIPWEDDDSNNVYMEAPSKLGSNAWAFGRATTNNGSGLLFGNPHYHWYGTNRFYQMHLTIPGELDVMGASLAPFPIVNIGFTQGMAWSHTVSSTSRSNLYELTLAPNDPLSYLVDGQKHRLQEHPVTVEVLGANGKLETATHTFYTSDFGPVVESDTMNLPWTKERAYALKDANRNNADMLDTWLDINRAQSVKELKTALSKAQGLPFVNTIGADRGGNVLYADIGRAPNISQEFIDRCEPVSGEHSASGTHPVLRGDLKACNWSVDNGDYVAQPLPASKMPLLIADDFVTNHNDSYWLTNPARPFKAMLPVLGPYIGPQNGRTRAGLSDIQNHLSQTKMSPATIEKMLFANKVYLAEIVMDDLMAWCATINEVTLESGEIVNMTDACQALAQWDRRVDLESRGSLIFYEWLFNALNLGEHHRIPFDATNPIGTPSGLNIDDPQTKNMLAQTLGKSVALLNKRGIPLDATLGDYQYTARNGQRIPVSGGFALNALLSEYMDGHYEPTHGSSYIQVVTFDQYGPVARGVLSYSQSTNPASPFYADQTELFSQEKLYNLPFSEAEISAELLSERVLNID